MFIIFNKDGSIFSQTQSNFVMQGSNRVNKVFVGFVDNEYSNWSCNGAFNLPNGTRFTIPGIPTQEGFEYLGVKYYGWVIELTAEVTMYAGTMTLTVQTVNQQANVLYTYLTNIIVNQTGLPLDGFWDSSITVAQFNDYMAQLAVKLQANTVSVVVSENELPDIGVKNVLYFIVGEASGTPYQVKMWNGSEYTLLGTINLSSFASKEEQKIFEQQVLSQIGQIRSEVANPFVVVSTTQDLPSTDQHKLYIVQANNHWYYWNGTQYTDGGVFIDSGITIENLEGQFSELGQALYDYIETRFNNGDHRPFFMNIESVANWVGSQEQVLPEGRAFGWYDATSNDIIVITNCGVSAIDNAYETRPIVNYNSLAERVIYDNSNSSLEATDVQGAIDEIVIAKEGMNILNLNTLTRGYIDINGNTQPASSLDYCSKLKVQEGDVIRFYTRSGTTQNIRTGGVRFITAYNGNTAVPSAGISTDGTLEYIVPSGIDGIIVSMAYNQSWMFTKNYVATSWIDYINPYPQINKSLLPVEEVKANDVSYINSLSSLEATDVQGAIDELAEESGVGVVEVYDGSIANTTYELGGFTGNEEWDSTTAARSGHIEVVAGKTIYCIVPNEVAGGYIIVSEFDENKNFIAGSNRNLVAKNKTGLIENATLTLSENTKYIRFFFTSGGVTNITISIYYMNDYFSYNIEEYKGFGKGINANNTYLESVNVISGFEAREKVLEDSKVELKITDEENYDTYKAKADGEELKALWNYVKKLHPPTILDEGECGPNLTWTLYSDGLLKISGTGRSYDFIKGVMIGKTEAEVNQYVVDNPTLDYYGFTEGKNYHAFTDSQGTFIGYVAPWYRYRDEKSFGTGGYTSREEYDRWNPNHWTYNRIEIDEGVTYLGDWMFYRVCGPTSLVIPEGVTELGIWCIRYCTTIITISLPNSLTTIGYCGISRHEDALKAIKFGNNLTSVGDYAFSTNWQLEYVFLPNTLTNIGDYCFHDDTNLKYVEMNGVIDIPKNCFEKCSKLEEVKIGSAVSIGENAFFKCYLKRLHIPSTLTAIGTASFYDATIETLINDSPTLASLYSSPTAAGRIFDNSKYVLMNNNIPFADYNGGLVRVFDKSISFNDYILLLKKNN